MKNNYLLITLICLLFVVNSCSEDDETQNPITTDISVTSSIQSFGWVDANDLNAKINVALSYNYGNALESEIKKSLSFNSDTTRVIAIISFKEQFLNKYIDQNISNNTAIIDLEKASEVNIEGNFGDNYTVASAPWSNCDLTFSFLNYSNDFPSQEQIEAFDRAAQTWASNISGLTITNVGFNNQNANIRVSFTENYNHPPCPTSFQNGILAHAYSPSEINAFDEAAGDIHFNDNAEFTNRDLFHVYDFETVALHELGHSLGLGHSSMFSAIMYASIIPFNKQTNLNQDDINAINQLYNNSDCVNNSGNSIINVNPSNWSFGNVQINSSPQQKEFIISNNGSSSFNVTNVSVNNSAFEIVGGQSATLQPSEEISFYVNFEPSSVQSYNATITITNNADSGSDSITLNGNGVDNNSNTSIISLSGNLNFGNIEVGQSDTRNFIISNNGNQSFNVSNIIFPNSVYSSNWNSGTINSGSSQNVTVTFQPTNVQSYNGSITVNHNADSGNGTISITGNGVNTNNGNSDINVEEISIDDEGNDEYDINVTFKNIGNLETPNNETINIEYFVNSNSVGSDTHSNMEPNEDRTEFLNNYTFPYNGTHTIQVVISQVSNEAVTTNNTMSVNFNNSGSSGNSITPSDNCNSAPIMQVDTEYEVTLDVGDYGLGSPIDGQSSGGDNVRGFWLRVDVPNNYSGAHDVLIYDVSSNFNPVVGLRGNCNGNYLGLFHSSSLPIYVNQSSNGGSETATTNMPGIGSGQSDSNDYYIRIYHYVGNETPNISFKIKVE